MTRTESEGEALRAIARIGCFLHIFCCCIFLPILFYNWIKSLVVKQPEPDFEHELKSTFSDESSSVSSDETEKV
ncbi:hypothetical protein OAG24_00310 [bacterium]|nr:hypothetical protein [bacterium]